MRFRITLIALALASCAHRDMSSRSPQPGLDARSRRRGRPARRRLNYRSAGSRDPGPFLNMSDNVTNHAISMTATLEPETYFLVAGSWTERATLLQSVPSTSSSTRFLAIEALD